MKTIIIFINTILSNKIIKQNLSIYYNSNEIDKRNFSYLYLNNLITSLNLVINWNNTKSIYKYLLNKLEKDILSNINLTKKSNKMNKTKRIMSINYIKNSES